MLDEILCLNFRKGKSRLVFSLVVFKSKYIPPINIEYLGFPKHIR